MRLLLATLPLLVLGAASPWQSQDQQALAIDNEAEDVPVITGEKLSPEEIDAMVREAEHYSIYPRPISVPGNSPMRFWGNREDINQHLLRIDNLDLHLVVGEPTKDAASKDPSSIDVFFHLIGELLKAPSNGSDLRVSFSVNDTLGVSFRLPLAHVGDKWGQLSVYQDGWPTHTPQAGPITVGVSMALPAMFCKQGWYELSVDVYSSRPFKQFTDISGEVWIDADGVQYITREDGEDFEEWQPPTPEEQETQLRALKVPGNSPMIFYEEPKDDVLRIDDLRLVMAASVDRYHQKWMMTIKGELTQDIVSEPVITLNLNVNGTNGISIEATLDYFTSESLISVYQDGQPANPTFLRKGPVELTLVKTLPWSWREDGEHTLYFDIRTKDWKRVTGFWGSVVYEEDEAKWSPAWLNEIDDAPGETQKVEHVSAPGQFTGAGTATLTWFDGKAQTVDFEDGFQPEDYVDEETGERPEMYIIFDYPQETERGDGWMAATNWRKFERQWRKE